MPKVRRESQSAKETSSGGSSSGGKGLKKGPWTAEEDAILLEYVNKHGEGNWNAVQKYSGLSRCGKSCRLRWANHLRPNLKKGSFTTEEEQRIIELHARFGNKWARMAAELPGRTDNEIKNFWNTRCKRLQRAGLPLYPLDITLKVAAEEVREGQNMSKLPNAEAHCHNPLQADCLGLPDFDIKNLEFNHKMLLFSDLLPNVPSGVLNQGIVPPNTFSIMVPSVLPGKYSHEPESLFHALKNINTSDDPLAFSQCVNCYDTVTDDPMGVSFYNPELVNAHDQLAQRSITLPDPRAMTNVNSSSSDPLPGALNSELPSLQETDAQLDSWETPSYPLPPCGSVDTLIQSSLTDQTQSDCHPTQKRGLLEAVVYESEMRKNSKWSSSQQASSSCPTSTAGAISHNSSFDSGGTEREANARCLTNPGSRYLLLNQSTKTGQIPNCAVTDATFDSDCFADGVEHTRNSPRDVVGDLLGYDYRVN